MLAYFANFGCHGNFLAPLKFWIAYLKSRTPKITFVQKNSSISCTELKSVQLWLILPKFGCYGNSLGFLENLDDIIRRSRNLDLTYMQKLCRYLAQK